MKRKLGGIFVSYRRNDSQGEAGRLFDDLVPVFGEQKVFMDVSAIEAGRDFRKAIEEGVTKCGVLLAVMGPEWLNAKDEAGKRRLDDPGDFVRIETAAALKRDIPLIPVLVRGAKMPSAEQLPDDLKDLAYRNAIELTHARWKSDIQLLVEALHRLLGDTTQAGATPSATAAPVQPASSRPEATESTKPEERSFTPIDPAFLQRVSRELALRIGPFADIAVRRAAPQCGSVEDLYLRVAEEIDSPEEREKFLQDRVPGASVPDTAKVQPPKKDAPELIAPRRPEKEEVAPKPAPPESKIRSSSRSKYLLVAGVTGAILILALVLATHFASSKEATSSQPAQTASQEAHPAEPAPLKTRAAPPPEPAANTSEPAPSAAQSAAAEPAPAQPASPEPSSVEPATARSEPKLPQRVRVPWDQSIKLIKTEVPPVYPTLAREARIQGTVVLDADISRDGAVESLKAISGHPMLIPAAVEAVKQWRFKPYLRKGEPVAISTQVVVKFTLTGVPKT